MADVRALYALKKCKFETLVFANKFLMSVNSKNNSDKTEEKKREKSVNLQNYSYS